MFLRQSPKHLVSDILFSPIFFGSKKFISMTQSFLLKYNVTCLIYIYIYKYRKPCELFCQLGVYSYITCYKKNVIIIYKKKKKKP